MELQKTHITDRALLYVHADDGIHKIDLSGITHLSSSGAYTIISQVHIDENLLVGKNLGRFEQALVGFGFFRIHKSHIVNMQRIDRYTGSKSGGLVELVDGNQLPVSRLRKSDFLIAFRKLAAVTV